MSQTTPSPLALESHDGLHLEGRLYSPASRESQRKTLAIVAHPYGPLGGTQNDPVVLVVVRSLVSLGITCVTYNARGVGNSEGKGSWTAESEGKDYQTVIERSVEEMRGRGVEAERVMACGYSAGSIAASLSSHPTIPTSHVLVSYPLDKLWALTLFRGGTCRQAIEDRIRAGGRILMIQGTQDQFTSDRNYSSWHASVHDKLGLTPSSPTSPLVVTRVDGADHFWSNSAHRRELQEALSAFASQAT